MENPSEDLVPTSLKDQMAAIEALPIARDEKVDRLRELLGYPICAATNREGGICTNKAGKGNPELLGQEGARCHFHGGRNQGAQAANYKHGRYAKIKTGRVDLYTKMLELAENSEDVFDLRDELLMLRTLARDLLEKGDDGAAAKLFVDAIKAAKDLNELEFQRRLVISTENVQMIVARVIDIINRHVPDPVVKAKMAQELAGIRVTTSLGRTPPRAIEGEVIDA